MYFSPLRYPGGKARLTPFIKLVLNKTGHIGGTYVEPFAGGAGIAINLLLEGIVSKVVINDLDKGIYSFWRAMLTETERFLDSIYTVKLNIEEWEYQRSICLNSSKKYSFELGFATFYMNRTNRSGIVKGGVIGGKCQSGKWKMDARFNRDSLANRIADIAQKRQCIHVYNKDIGSFLECAEKHFVNSLLYFDPPYYQKGHELYMNYFTHKDHVRIRDTIEQLRDTDWLLTYDDCPEIKALYKDCECKKIQWNYSVSSKKTVYEIMVFKDRKMIPSSSEIYAANIKTKLGDL